MRLGPGVGHDERDRALGGVRPGQVDEHVGGIGLAEADRDRLVGRRIPLRGRRGGSAPGLVVGDERDGLARRAGAGAGAGREQQSSDRDGGREPTPHAVPPAPGHDGVRQSGQLGAVFSHDRMYATTSVICWSVSGPPYSFHHAGIAVPGTPPRMMPAICSSVVPGEELLRVQRRRAHALAVQSMTRGAVETPELRPRGDQGGVLRAQRVGAPRGFDRLVDGERHDRSRSMNVPTHVQRRVCRTTTGSSRRSSLMRRSRTTSEAPSAR